MSYKPRAASLPMLERAWAHVSSVKYRVSLRWLFYRLLQDPEVPEISEKEDYLTWKDGPIKRVRDESWGPWRPWSLVDDTRAPIRRQGNDGLQVSYSMDRAHGQNTRLAIMFEARAMASQFRYYTQGIDLWPAGGDPSLDYKDDLLRWVQRYQDGLPVHILYFGDADEKGEQIPRAVFASLEKWAPDLDFTWEFPGLTIPQARDLGMPLKAGKGDREEYQWEALTDPQAHKIITNALAPYWDEELYQKVAAHERRLGILTGNAARRKLRALAAMSKALC